MDNLGSEVGQKMRSAVKAKLIELGTGGLAGYIDDELPDYVMIMIANKRSKQQMIGDLKLFLGSQTELFVTWLHEVLQKLQEVTLPAAVIHKTKRKSEGNDAPIAGKKEKKEKKKEKEKEKEKEKKAKKAAEQQQQQHLQQIQKDSNQQLSGSGSITDVFADHLLQKAKKTMQTESIMTAKVKKGESSSSSSTSASVSTVGGMSKITRDEFDIPTITEISESVEEISRKKDLEELSKLQKKIYQAKAKLKLTEMEESEDDDCLNIRAEGEELDEVVATERTESQNNRKNKVKNPIVYETSPKNDDKQHDENRSNRNISNDKDDKVRDFDKTKKRVHITFSSDQKKVEDENREVYKKKPIHERLGFITRSPIKSSGSSISSNLPSIYRRLDNESSSFSPTVSRISRSVERSNEEYSSGTEKDEIIKDKIIIKKKDNRMIDENVIMRRRIGSRVIVAPPKKIITEEDDDYNEISDKTVSSMIKIKPRPPISPSKQASKNLLLRAVAEAQKSTALIKPKKDLIHERSPKRLNTKSQKLHTKLYHNRSSSSNVRRNIVKHVTKDNIVIEIKSNKSVINQIDDTYEDEDYVDDDVNKSEDEYVPEPIHDRGDSDNDYVYIPQTINFDTVDDTSESCDENEGFSQNKTQFVVTLDDKSRKKYITTQHQKQQKTCLYTKNLNGIEKIERTSIKSQDTRRDRLKISTNSMIHKDEEESSSLSHEFEFSSPKRSINDRQYEDENSNSNSKSSNSKFIKTKEQIKKIIKKYDTENDNNNKTIDNKKPSPAIVSTITTCKVQHNKENLQKENYKITDDNDGDDKNEDADGSLTPPLPKSMSISLSTQTTTTTTTTATATATTASVMKRKRSPIKFDIDPVPSNKNTSIKNSTQKENKEQHSKNNSDSSNTATSTISDTATEENTHKISIKKIESNKKYENIPESLNSIAVEAPSKLKVKERCKYFPTCSRGDTCEYYHPTTPCKAFPNCKFVEKCLYLHPKCKYDLTCNRINCNFSHSAPTSVTTNVAPPLASHVVPVQNYKSISANPLPAICKYYPNCTNSLCNFYHPKLCRFGKNCMNKVECNFYHFDLPVKDKFKWVASLG